MATDHIHCPQCGVSVPIVEAHEHRCRAADLERIATKVSGFHEDLKAGLRRGVGMNIDDALISVKKPASPTAARCLEIAKDALDMFIERNKKYGDAANRLGMRGQYADINRKVVLLERWIWDGVEPEGSEGVVEVCEDLIGHLLLTIDQFKENLEVIK